MAIPVEKLGLSPRSDSDTIGLGWLRDLPDIRDYNPKSKVIADMLAFFRGSSKLPESIDLRSWCSPIKDQGQLGSCTAHAALDLFEYYERRAMGRSINASRLFLYKTTRDLMGVTGDTGANLRTTMKAITVFGAPPENYWTYDVSKFDAEPDAFLYSFGGNYKAFKYYRLDPPGVTSNDLLTSIKTHLYAGFLSSFGFTVCSSIEQASSTGKIPFPLQNEIVLGGHAANVVGYDDKIKILNTDCSLETIGAFRIRNSWGTRWGRNGYGWLPYDYVLRGLTADWWILISDPWIDTGSFFGGGGGHLFGEPESIPRNSYRCPKHKQIPTSEVDWHGTDAYCPHCGQKLMSSASRQR